MVVLGPALDGLAGRFDTQAFIAGHGVGFPNRITEESDAAAISEPAAGEVWIGTPTFLIFSPDGKLAARQVGGVTQKLIDDFIAGAERQPPRACLALWWSAV